MIATLPMYDWPEVREATDAWWAGIVRHARAHGLAAPDRLSRGEMPGSQWRRPDLIVSQTCGYPLTHEFKEKLQLLATPHYAVEDCSGADYRSVVVVHAAAGFSRPDDLRGATAVYNGADSLSGYLALRCVFAPLSKEGRFFGQVVASGGHSASMLMLHQRQADVAAIDCVSFALARRYRPDLAGSLAVIARGPCAPALPYVTASGQAPEDVARLKRALAGAAADPQLAAAREALFIAGLEFLPLSAYQKVLDLEAACDARGYPALA
jgi:ABC-type phosphate/phosphonate transport system substrate-binding protein